MTVRAFVFDFDYTLADSEKGIVSCFRLVLDAHGVSAVTDDAIKRTIGLTLEQAFGVLMGEHDPERLAALRKEYVAYADERMVAGTKLYPAVPELFREIRLYGAKIGILSTKYAYRILATLDAEGITEYVDCLIGGADVAHAKPDPEGLFAMSERLCVPVDEILYIGDSTVDAETAFRAGAPFVGVAQGATTAEELASYPHVAVVPSIEGLKDFVESRRSV